MSAMPTLAPSWANRMAAAFPIPLAPPVMNATFPSSIPIVLLPLSFSAFARDRFRAPRPADAQHLDLLAFNAVLVDEELIDLAHTLRVELREVFRVGMY